MLYLSVAPTGDALCVFDTLPMELLDQVGEHLDRQLAPTGR
jgi:hypothetical protein